MVKKYFDYYFYRSLENTNDKIKDLSVTENKKSNLALFSHEQKKGRGRKNRLWISEKGDLTCSFLIRKSIKIKDLGKINLFIVSIIMNILKNLGIKNIEFKWPNDIFIKKKKVAGILIETTVNGGKINKFIIGIGINIVKKTFKQNIQNISLSELKINLDAINFFFLISKKLSDFTTNMNKINYENLSQTLSKVFFKKTSIIKINLGKEFLNAKFKKIDSSGQLVLTNDDKDFKLNYGEII